MTQLRVATWCKLSWRPTGNGVCKLETVPLDAPYGYVNVLHSPARLGYCYTDSLLPLNKLANLEPPRLLGFRHFRLAQSRKKVRVNRGFNFLSRKKYYSSFSLCLQLNFPFFSFFQIKTRGNFSKKGN